jgi:hypothetical protein
MARLSVINHIELLQSYQRYRLGSACAAAALSNGLTIRAFNAHLGDYAFERVHNPHAR